MTQRAVVATASYEARRRGVRSGMPLRTAAKRCPEAVFLPADNPHYEQVSDEVMTVLREPAPWVPRSRSRETTFQTDLADWADVRTEVAALARTVAAEVGDRPAARVAVTVRFVPFRTATRSATLPAPTSDPDRFAAAALDVLERFPTRRPVRLVGVRAEFARS